MRECRSEVMRMVLLTTGKLDNQEEGGSSMDGCVLPRNSLLALLRDVQVDGTCVGRVSEDTEHADEDPDTVKELG